MLLALVASLIISADVAPADPRLAPDVPPWPAGLPAPVESDAGTLLPPALADVVHQRLLALDAMPGRCQVRIDGLGRIHRAELAASVDVAVAEAGAARIVEGARSRGWPEWAVAIAVGAGILLGGAAGVGVARLAR